MKIAAYSEKGNDKAECQDKILVGDTILSEGFYEVEKEYGPLAVAVSDGVGGNAAGEKAAMMSVHGMRRLSHMDDCDEDTIKNIMYSTNREIISTSEENEECRNMAATLTGIYFYTNRDTVFHVGNSRIMLYSSGIVSNITDDQTETITDEYGREKQQNLGGMGNGDEFFLNEYIYVQREEFYLEKGAILMITSDGVHDYVSEDELGSLIMDTPTQIEWEKDFCFRVAKKARNSGSVDDISIVLIHA